MNNSFLHRTSASLKKHAPSWLFNGLRSIATAVLGPIRFGYRSGYFRSALKMSAVTKTGEPLLWYTYPSIDFLSQRQFKDKNILEFGGGQSTLWWAPRAKKVLTLEGDQGWYDKIKSSMPSNVELHHVAMDSEAENIEAVNQKIEQHGCVKYDVIVIDGLHRSAMIDVAIANIADNGIIICDNAEGYGFYEGFKDKGFSRVDFFGNAPGVVLPHATSFYFKGNSFVFDADYPIVRISDQ